MLIIKNYKRRLPPQRPKDCESEQKVRQFPDERQQFYLDKFLPILRERRYRDNAETIELFQRLGFTPQWKRVKWVGGVGSWRIMRGGRLRLQISSSIQGHDKQGKLGYRYATCIEI